LISVIIPSYNAAHHLLTCLKAIYDNDFKDYEVIVVDDGSTDNTSEIIKNFPCCYFRNDKNLGAAATRNKGAQEAQGEILLFIDADVDIKSNVLELFDHHFKSADFDVVTGAYSKVPKLENIFLQFISSLSNYNFSKTNFGLSTHLTAMRKESFFKIGGFDETIKGATVEDFDMYCRVIAAGFKCMTDMRIEAYHNQAFTFYTFYRRMFRFGLLKTPLILHYRKNRAMKDQENRYLVNSEYISTYILILFLLPVIFVALYFQQLYPLIVWFSLYFLVKRKYMATLNDKRILMFGLLLINDVVVLTGIILGTIRYCCNRLLRFIRPMAKHEPLFRSFYAKTDESISAERLQEKNLVKD